MVGRKLRRDLRDLGQGMGRLQGRDDAFRARTQLEGGQRLYIRDSDIFHAARLMEPGVLGSDAGIVEARGNRVRVLDLTIRILQQIGSVAVQNAGAAGGKGSGVFASFNALACRLDTDQPHIPIIEERIKQSDRIGTAADARHEAIRDSSLGFHDLLASLPTDHRLEVPHHLRIGVGAGDGAD